MPEPIKVIEGKAMPLEAENVDTDQIIPAQFLKLISRKGLGRYAFYRWRYDEEGKPRPEFILNNPKFKGASILIAGENFGIGSSRENAVWALKDLGIKCVIAPSFGDIFYNNAAKNMLLCIKLPEPIVKQLQERAKTGNLHLRIDLEEQKINGEIPFEVEPHIRERFLKGLDEISLTLEKSHLIKNYEDKMPSFLKPKPNMFIHE